MTIGVFVIAYLGGILLLMWGPMLVSNGILPKWTAGLGPILSLLDPYTAYFSAMAGSRMPTSAGPSWVLHCPISLAMSAAILGSACIRLRKVMIRQAFDPNRVGIVGKALGAGRPGPIRVGRQSADHLEGPAQHAAGKGLAGAVHGTAGVCDCSC